VIARITSPKPSDHPSIPRWPQYNGRGRRRDLPGYVMLPAFPGYSQGPAPGRPYGGIWEALTIRCSAPVTRCGTGPTSATRTFTITLSSLAATRSCRRSPRASPRRPRAPSHPSPAARRPGPPRPRRCADRRQQQAFDLLTSPTAQQAFDLGREAATVRERYGRNCSVRASCWPGGWSRAGVTFVTVHTGGEGQRPWGHAQQQLSPAPALPATVPRSRLSRRWLDDLSRAACSARRW